MKIAVIGAGIAGLACARRLADAGHAVTVFERESAAGGRVATMRTEIGGFDHGAQYLTARHASFVDEVDRWRAAGVVAPWTVVAHAIAARSGADHPASRPASTGQTLRWVGVPGMAAIATHLAAGLDVRYESPIVAIDAVVAARGVSPRWSLQRFGGSDAAGPITEGLFDVVVIAVPAETAALLLAASPTLARQAGAARIEPCWALMIGFVEPIAAGLTTFVARVGDAAFVDGGRLAWIARESSKPGRRLGERWTVHAQSAWSVEHFDDDPEDAKAKLLRAFHEATGTIEQPIYATAFRWRHALARSSLSCDFLWDSERRVGACGDWCRGYRVEDAWLSGVSLAATVSSAG